MPRSWGVLLLFLAVPLAAQGVSPGDDDLRPADELVARLEVLTDPQLHVDSLFEIAREARQLGVVSRDRVVDGLAAHRRNLERLVHERFPQISVADCERALEKPGTQFPLQRACRWAGWIVASGSAVPLAEIRDALDSDWIYRRYAALWVLLDEPGQVETCLDGVEEAMVAEVMLPGGGIDHSGTRLRDGHIGWQTRLLAARVAVGCPARPELRERTSVFLYDGGDTVDRVFVLQQLALFPPTDPLLRYRVIRSLQSVFDRERSAALATLGAIGVPGPDDRPPSRAEALARLRRGPPREEGWRLARYTAWAGPTDEDVLRILDAMAEDTESPGLARAAARIAAQIRASW